MDSSPRTSSSPPSRRRIGSVNSTSTCWKRSAAGCSVNFCAEDFEQEGALEKTLGILEAYRIPVSAIVLEITVREIASAQNTFCEKIRQFREAGFAIWMDNFGSGCSFLNVFGTYHFDLIKLDMVFISGLAGKEAMGQTEGSSERFWTVLLIPASTPSQRVWKQRDSLPFLPRQAASHSLGERR